MQSSIPPDPISSSPREAARCPFHARAPQIGNRLPPDPNAPASAVRLSPLASLRLLFDFLGDPISAVAQVNREHGPFVVGRLPISRRNRSDLVIITGDARINREVLGQPDVWRTVNISMAGRRNHPSRLLFNGLVRMQGARHAHYRKLSLPPLKRRRIEGFDEGLSAFVAERVEAWPLGTEVDLWSQVKELMQQTAVAFLFGDDRGHGYALAQMVSAAGQASFSKRVNGLPLDVPGTPFARELRRAEAMERLVTEWAASQGALDEGSLLSMVLHHPDERGCPVSGKDLLQHLPTLLGAAFETCQNAAFWTLTLLEQHPDVARRLQQELASSGTGVKALDGLPWLDAVVKESMRLFPPVPQQFRVSTRETSLAGLTVPAGTRILLSSYLNNRDPARYPAPDQFLPERWATLDPSAYEYSAFSAGPRSCPGYWFGMAVVKCVVSTIHRRFKIDFSATPRLDYMVRLALSPRGRIRVRLSPQDGTGTPSIRHGGFLRLLEARNPETFHEVVEDIALLG